MMIETNMDWQSEMNVNNLFEENSMDLVTCIEQPTEAPKCAPEHSKIPFVSKFSETIMTNPSVCAHSCLQ